MGGRIPPGMPPMLAAAGPAAPPGALPSGAPKRFVAGRTQVRFARPSGMKVSWFTMGADGKPSYSPTPIETPGRYNFPQASIYRLKLSGIEGRPGLEVYPTLEVVPANPKTEAFLAHSSVPVEFTNEDFQQISEGNYVVKVIYLPDPQFQELAGTGTDEIVSTRLEPGADPIKEALRRGSILLVIRMGNMDQEAPNTPPLDAPPPGGLQRPPHGVPGMPPGMPGGMMGPGMHGPGPMVPYNPMGMMGGGPMMGPMGGLPMGPGGPSMPPATYPTGLPSGVPPARPMGPTPSVPPAPRQSSAAPLPKAAAQNPVRPAAAFTPAGKAPSVPAQPAATSPGASQLAIPPAGAAGSLPMPPTPAALATQGGPRQ
jgi:hypothetical protein